MTLDNPEVLEQQLEALEHHKKVLERRAQLQQKINQQDGYYANTSQVCHTKSASDPSTESSSAKSVSPAVLQDKIYENTKLPSNGSSSKSRNGSSEFDSVVYSNILYGSGGGTAKKFASSEALQGRSSIFFSRVS